MPDFEILLIDAKESVIQHEVIEAEDLKAALAEAADFLDDAPDAVSIEINPIAEIAE